MGDGDYHAVMNWKRRNIAIVIIVAAAVLVLSGALAMWFPDPFAVERLLRIFAG